MSTGTDYVMQMPPVAVLASCKHRKAAKDQKTGLTGSRFFDTLLFTKCNLEAFVNTETMRNREQKAGQEESECIG